MVNITQLGITLTWLSDDFQEFKFDILTGYLMRFGQTMNEFGFPTFHDFIESKGYEGFDLNGFHSVPPTLCSKNN